MNKDSFRKAGVHWGILFGVFIVTLMLCTQMVPTPKIETEPTWHVIWEGSLAEATEANPGAGASGFLEIFFLNHSGSPGAAYNENTSSIMEGWANTSLDADGAAGIVNHAYATLDNFHLELKHTTAFDIVVRVRYNRTHAWNGTMFRKDDTRVNITASGGGIAILGTVSGYNIESYNSSIQDFIWINVYWNGVGAGYNLGKGQTCTISQISIQAKY